MNRVRSAEEYRELVRLTKERTGKTDTNCVIMSSEMERYILQDRLYSRTFPEGLALYIDEGRYYEMYYFWAVGSPLPDLRADKPVSAVEIGTAGRKTDHLERMEQRFPQAGFELYKTTLQLEADLRALGYDLTAEYERRTAMVKEQGLTLTYCPDELLPQVHSLWAEYLDLADVPMDHLRMDEESKILCAVTGDGQVAAVQWWKCGNRSSEGRHTVTHPAFYRRGLASCLLLSQFVYTRDRGVNRVYTWINDDNLRSLAAHEKVGFSTNGRIAKQYVLK